MTLAHRVRADRDTPGPGGRRAACRRSRGPWWQAWESWRWVSARPQSGRRQCTAHGAHHLAWQPVEAQAPAGSRTARAGQHGRGGVDRRQRLAWGGLAGAGAPGGGSRWCRVGDRVGARSRRKKPFDFPILRWVKARYFHAIDGHNWVFMGKGRGPKGSPRAVRLFTTHSLPITRYVKIDNRVNPYYRQWEALPRKAARTPDDRTLFRGRKTLLSALETSAGTLSTLPRNAHNDHGVA